MIHIIIADDHPIFRSGITNILQSIPDITLVGEAENGLDAYQLILSELPDIAILDLEMPLLTGLDVCKKVLSEKHNTRFIILTMHKERHFFLDAMASGVHGYLLKDNAIQDLEECIQAVSKGHTFISSTIENYLTDFQLEQSSTVLHQINQLLTPTEKVILKLISESKSSPEIAGMLFISANTVDNHRANMNKKLQLGGEKNALLKFAIANKDVLKF
jgi:DNA-binding NarL/FixJ family response regulator